MITEDHYIDYLTKTDIGELLPAELLGQARRESHFLFLGYSMRDWNLRVILHRIWGQQALEVQVLGDPEGSERDRAGSSGRRATSTFSTFRSRST